MSGFHRVLLRALLVAALLLPADLPSQADETAPAAIAEVEPSALHHLLKLTDQVYVGGQPHGEAGFAALQKLGVKIVVSVDGAQPQVKLAHKYGLRYVHIPIGYDGVAPQAQLALARLALEKEPMYVHCHHGEHRGPAAAAIVCMAGQQATHQEAVGMLQRAGTSRKYSGLWRDIRQYERPGPNARLPELVEVARVGSYAAAMAQIDRAFDNLKLIQAAGWKTPAEHPDVSPAQQAVLLEEGYREAIRSQQEDPRPGAKEPFAAWLRTAHQESAQLAAALEAFDSKRAEATFQAVKTSCTRCHAEYRD
ncbi:protein-tyrosine phosphatase family protein [Lignipirellula cremea]|uniref:Cytochrome C n=1 Tax=Lignipirellula cremea TaxID=2528010 RepID=A0A518DV72_9BACT|nr:cytochrome c [Lignipirellula cremea]QDU95735.1 hypothetical protein Pla8534_35520 [Lignipirellula cremea]